MTQLSLHLCKLTGQILRLVSLRFTVCTIWDTIMAVQWSTHILVKEHTWLKRLAMFSRLS